MADYHPLIARAIDGLGTSTGEARRALYERARAALVAQLRSIEPPLSEADITRERLALGAGSGRVEPAAARRARAEPRPAAPPLRSPPSVPRPQTPPASAMPPRRERPNLAQGAAPPRAESPRMERQPCEPPPPQRPAAPANEPPRSAAPLGARERLLNARTSPASPLPREGLRGLRGRVHDGG